MKKDIGDNGGATDTDLQSYMDAKGFDIHDLKVARRILNEENVAHKRVPVVNTESVEGDRLFSLSPSRIKHAPEYFQANSAGKRADALSFSFNSQTYSFQDYYLARKGVLPHRSAVDFIGYLRDAALRPLTKEPAITNLEDSEVQKLYGVVAKNLQIYAGDRRFRIYMEPEEQHWWTDVYVEGKFEKNGSDSKEIIVLIRDRKDSSDQENAGYRCAVEGSIDGSPCSLTDYDIGNCYPNIYSTRDRYNQVLPADHAFSESITCGAETSTDQLTWKIWVFTRKDNGPLRLIGGVVPGSVLNGQTSGQKIMPVNGEAPKILTHVAARDPEDCDKPQMHCTGLSQNLVPPLENESNENSDNYENSWKYYLSIAKQAALETDALGEKLIESGLQMDLRAEQAASQAEDICGGVVNVGDVFGGSTPTTCNEDDCSVIDEYSASDPTLQSCLPTADDYVENVSLSTPLCVFKIGTNASCVCPEGVLCPACPKQVNEGVDCASLYSTDPLYSDFIAAIPVWTYYGDHLNLIGASLESPQTQTNCEIVRTLRKDVEDGKNLEPFQVASITSQPWFTVENFKTVAQKYMLNSEPLFHYKLMKHGQPYLSTYPSGGCVRRYPWRDADGETNPPIICGADYDSNYSLGDRIEDEFDDAIAERIKWGYRLGNIFKTISYSTGEIRGFTLPKARARGTTHSDSGDGDGYGPLQFPYKRIHGESPDGDERVCLFTNSESDFVVPVPLGNSFEYGLANLVDLSGGYHEESAIARWRLLGGLNGCHADSGRYWFHDYDAYSGKKLHQTYISAYDLWHPGNASTSLAQEIARPSTYPKMTETRFNEQETGVHVVNVGQVKFRRYDVEGNGSDTVVPAYFTSQSLWDTLEFVCRDYEDDHGSCLSVQDLPDIENIPDVLKLKTHIQCVAKEVMDRARTITVAKIPKAVVDAFRLGGDVGSYPDAKGRQYDALVAIETSLRNIKNSLESIGDITFQAGELISGAHSKMVGIDIQGEIGHLQSMQALVKAAAGAAKGLMNYTISAMSGDPVKMLSSGIDMAADTYCAGLENQIMALKENLTDSDISTAIHTFLEAYSGKVSQLRVAEESVLSSVSTLKTTMNDLESLKNKAASAVAMATFADSDTVGHVFYVNTVMRRRYNTNRILYENSLKRAKKFSWVARRAIEFRFGVDLSKIHQDMQLVEAPSTWADRLCEFSGIDYSIIRDATMLQDPNWMGESDNYAHAYIGEYVKKLEDFVTSYSFDYPFHESEDLAVVSLKQDILNVTGTCTVPSHNLLRYSASIGKINSEDEENSVSIPRGWMSIQDCGDVEGEHWDESECMAIDTYTADTAHPSAVAIYDKTHAGFDGTYIGRTPGTKNGGYVAQIVDIEKPGNYILSFWVKDLSGAPTPTNMRLALTSNGNPIPTVGTEFNGGEKSFAPQSTWTLMTFRFNLPSSGTVLLEIHPSAYNSSNPGEEVIDEQGNAVHGSIAMDKIQLEYVEPDRCTISGGTVESSCEPLPFEAVDADLTISVDGCDDQDGSIMRKRFERKCICTSPTGMCADSPDNPYIKCYYEVNFALSLEDMESGKLMPSSSISLFNYNYRHNKVALNLVGTNVRECPDGSSSSCYANAYVPFSMHHSGKVRLRNHERQTMSFEMDEGKIVRAKSLAAEVLVTNPMSSSHATLLNDYYKMEIRGRPLQGQYVLRIWDDNYMNWNNVEDVQLIWKYRYWTQFENNQY
ncbi:hypothetical protein KKF84_01420 [Myxococcota bacterium]|nr:hypothetical protein [Myxococcota bacterium]